jgi:putative restriction endonuclease
VDITLKAPGDLLSLTAGDTVTKENLFALIQYSKQPDSQYWGGADLQIGNTPQQGINWIGSAPACLAAIVKTSDRGLYQHDGWQGPARDVYRYSFKKQAGVISYDEKANSVLIHQPQYGYPVLLFTERDSVWVFQGTFAVVEIAEEHVILTRGSGEVLNTQISPEEHAFREGGRRYVTHLLAERNRAVVSLLKTISAWQCDICTLAFASRYGVHYIEAHHKVPITTYSADYTVTIHDFAVLCPNCHKAVHIHMRLHKLEYEQIKSRLQKHPDGNR